MNKLMLLFTVVFLTVFIPVTDAFPAPQQETPTTYIRGKVAGHTADSVWLDSKGAALDPEGNFRFQLMLDEARVVKLKGKDAEIKLYAEPHKDIFVSFEENNVDETLQFKGPNAAVNEFLFNQQAIGQSFNNYFNKNVNSYLYKLPEHEFVREMDSLQSTFLEPLAKLRENYPDVNQAFVQEYKTDIELIFLAFLADYPLLHQKNTGNTVVLSESSREKISSVDINDPSLHKYDGFKGLLRNFLYQETNKELQKRKYADSDNKRLDAGIAVIKKTFSNQEVFDKVLYEFLLNHIENLGIKNIENNLAFFNAHCRNESYKEKINTLYEEAYKKRQGHIIRTYKEVNGYKLDAHLFMPDSLAEDQKVPAIAMFHGGSFYEGKPDWFFSTAERYAKQGWVAVAVEYRVADRHDNLLPEAISDGKSLVRFLREHAEELKIDTSKVLVTGNSSGATIALALATLDSTLDEPNENQEISSRPNAIMINAGLADLTGSGHHWWHKHYEPAFIKSISPLQQVKEGLPPMLIVHGTNDNSVDIASIRLFAQKSKELGNTCNFYELKGAPHVIWLIPYFSRQINEYRSAFLKELNWF